MLVQIYSYHCVPLTHYVTYRLHLFACVTNKFDVKYREMFLFLLSVPASGYICFLVYFHKIK